MIRKSICENTVLAIEGNQKNIDILNGALGNIELTQEEERSLIWLSNWETSTVKHIISAFEKAKIEKKLDKDNYVYPSIFEIDEDGRIGVTFPDLQGAITCGDNLEEAIKNAKECMGLHLFGMERDNDIIPEPTIATEIETEDNQVVMLIKVYMPTVREEIMRERERKKK